MAADVLSSLPADGYAAAASKVSRYRSPRTSLPDDELPRPPPPPVPVADGGSQSINRSMSRYHRPRAGTGPSLPHAGPAARVNRDHEAAVPAVPQRAPQAPSMEDLSPRHRSHTVGAQAPPSSRGYTNYESPVKTARRPATSHRSDKSSRHAQDGYRHANEGAQLLADEAARLERVRAQQILLRDAQISEKEAKRKAQELERAQKVAERRKIEELERQLKARDAEVERLRKENEAKMEDERRWKYMAEEDQRQRGEAEARRSKAKERENAEMQKRENRLAKERPTNIAALPISDHEAPYASPPSSMSSPGKKFGFFKRRRDDDASRSPMSPPTSADSRSKTSYASPPKTAHGVPPMELPTIKPGGGGIVPLDDAPVSAANYGNRRVRVEYGRSFITLPVTPTTSALQLIRSASTIMSEAIDPRAAVLNEIFTETGVQRPLRMFEHIRDVMNSWADDEQHSLFIESTGQGVNNELYAAFTPKVRPSASAWWLYYSQKPGKWEKKWITLRSDGQITLAKNETGKDLSNICHLSDFDVYSPTPSGKKRIIRPPKKYCHSIKSQQKRSMFLTTANFLHIFCTNDRQVASDFFTKIQAWRSWYLVNVMGEGKASKGEQKPAEPEKAKGSHGGFDSRPSHKRTASSDSHYVLGTLSSLDFDPNAFTKQTSQPQRPPRRSTSFSENTPLANYGLIQPSALAHSMAIKSGVPPPQRQLSKRQHPPLAFRNPPAHDSGYGGRPSTSHQGFGGAGDAEQTSFNPYGLLGAQYEQRQQKGQQLHRTSSIRSTTSRRNSIDGGTLNRTSSIRAGMPKPLVDLTPQYKEPPQFQKKGKGFKPDHIAPGGLIDNATTPFDTFVAIPPSQDWRARPTTSSGTRPTTSSAPRPTTSATQAPLRQHHRDTSSSSRRGPATAQHSQQLSGNMARTASLRGHGVKMGHGSGGPIAGPGEAFTGGGLLATSGPGWGSGDRGHGIMSGNHAQGPMLDMTEKSKFAAGSLLAKRESEGPSF
jgi:hypothetical protein